jgi:hypothetical protein
MKWNWAHARKNPSAMMRLGRATVPANSAELINSVWHQWRWRPYNLGDVKLKAVWAFRQCATIQCDCLPNVLTFFIGEDGLKHRRLCYTAWFWALWSGRAACSSNIWRCFSHLACPGTGDGSPIADRHFA